MTPSILLRGNRRFLVTALAVTVFLLLTAGAIGGALSAGLFAVLARRLGRSRGMVRGLTATAAVLLVAAGILLADSLLGEQIMSVTG